MLAQVQSYYKAQFIVHCSLFFNKIAKSFPSFANWGMASIHHLYFQFNEYYNLI